MSATFEPWTTYLSVAANIVTIAGFVALGFQLSQSKKQFREVVRARLAVTAEKIQLRGRPAVGLIITNHGQTPARNVSIAFDPGQKFHSLRGHENLMFLAPKSIERIDAGESLTFTLGPLVGSDNMSHVLTSSLSGKISFQSTIRGKSETEPFQVTLSQKGFLISRTSINR